MRGIAPAAYNCILSPEVLDPPAELASALRRYWGYDSFRPMQERIVRSILRGKDVAVVMPTGGGKSLCYQLPALVSGKTAVVVSPLIALMQDQAAQLKQMGIPAAVFNSSMPQSEQAQTMREACEGAYRLLYLSPERLVRADTIPWLSRVPIGFFAIDEAHCISEWGHEFRPEYRQLSRLRENFPDRPIAAFTASATRQVRHDIIRQLRLEEPDKYIVSFHRPNLRYIVRECDSKTQPRLLLNALRALEGNNIIVYAPTIARVEETVDFLGEHGISAVPYHGQMETEMRRRNQERWMSDEVQVLVGTIAFGLGINKAAVRAVIHLSLPKSIEQYYQEAGRAGRDGLPADCLLLWRKQDAGLLVYFIEQLRDAGERQRSWDRYRTMRGFVDNAKCRHRQVCLHFGETPKWETCGMCDVCAATPAWLDGKLWKQSSSAPVKAGPEPDRELLELMREWRRDQAKQKGVPAFMVLSDASLLDLCARPPKDYRGLLTITGIGEKKAEQFGDEILRVLSSYAGGQRASAQPLTSFSTPQHETLRLLREGRTLAEIAQLRSRQIATIAQTVAAIVEDGSFEFQESWIREAYRAQIEEVVRRIGGDKLKPLKDALPPEVTFDEIRLVMAKVRRSKLTSPQAG